MWNYIAQFIARRPWLVDAIIHQAQKRPYRHLMGYMGRWYLLPGGPAAEEASKWLRWLPVAIRVHHIQTADSGRDLHDHPFDFRTVILRGGYVEEDLAGDVRGYIAGDTYFSPAERFHRISGVARGGAWTMVFIFSRRNQWGFLTEDGKVGHREYLGEDA